MPPPPPAVDNNQWTACDNSRKRFNAQPNGTSVPIISLPRLRRHWGRGGSKKVRAREWAVMLRNAVFWVSHGYGNHESTANILTCTRLTQNQAS